METRTRTIAKALTWQGMGLIMMMLIGYVFTGSAISSVFMAVLTSSLSLFTYFLHERVWGRVKWGLARMAEMEAAAFER